jgi:hypothetical protein
MIDDLTPWNPAHFGHTDFQKEPDGQLTIFFEDAHEPPDPDDFASVAAYEIAWADWETQQTLPQQEDTIMAFNIATPFDSEIEQLKAKLAELETQKHRLATCANRIVDQVGECVIEMKGAGASDEILNNWACVIYKGITGRDVPALSDSDVLKSAIAWEEKYNQISRDLENSGNQIEQLTQGRDTALKYFLDLTNASLRVSAILKDRVEEISQLKSANFEVTAMLETAVAQRDHYQGELQELQSGNGETSDNLLIEGYKKTIIELTIANEKVTGEYLQLRRQVCLPTIKSDELVAKPEEGTDAQPEELNEDPRQNPEFLEATNNQGIVSEFLRKLDRTARVDKLDWVKIKELPLNLDTMRELGLQVSSKSKTHKHLLEQMPVMCAKYINRTGDSSDLDWLPGHFVESVREALSEISDATEDKTPRATSLSEEKPTIQSGDTVRHTNLDSVCTVLGVNGGWLNVRADDGVTDMWDISDVELVAELAA